MRIDPINSGSESRSLDFKRTFDSASTRDWCELIKDIVAMANSGGGVILVGVDDDGQSTGDSDALKIADVDPAVFTDKLAKYTGVQFDRFKIDVVTRRGEQVAMIEVGFADAPMIFEKPGK